MIARFEAANRAAVKLMNEGHIVFSPITHRHPLAEAGKLPPGWDFWEKFCRAYLDNTKEMRILRLDGWDESEGIGKEIIICGEMDIPYSHMEPV